MYKVKDLQWTKIDAVTIGTVGEQMTVSYYSYPATEQDAGKIGSIMVLF